MNEVGENGDHVHEEASLPSLHLPEGATGVRSSHTFVEGSTSVGVPSSIVQGMCTILWIHLYLSRLKVSIRHSELS